MSSHPVPNLRLLAPGIILALLSIAFGFLLGGFFGAAIGGTLFSVLRQLIAPPVNSGRSAEHIA
jgi:hypothetical protein